MAIETTGIRAVVENYQGFMKAVDSVNARIAEVGKKAQAAAKQSSSLDKSLGGVSTVVNRFASAVGGVPGPVGSATGAISDMIGKLGILSPAAMAGVAAVTALVTAFVALGMRGAAMRGIIESFDRLTASVGVLGSTLLGDMRKAAAGTIRDMDLLRIANLALAGAVGEFGKQFGSKLPKILEIARVQARATGQDVDFLFNSLIMGIKRGSPLLIDNTGLVLKVSQAQQDYATSIGKTVEQLTTEEKQIALLNATLAAGETAIKSLGDLQETAAEKIARANATISNMFDRLALAMQPAFEQILDVVNRFLSSVAEVVNGLAPIIGAVVSIITQVITNVLDSIGMFIEPFKNMLVSFLPYIAILVQGIQRGFAFISDVVKNVFGGILKFLQDVAKNLFGIDVNNLGKNMFEGAAAIFGSFANGIAVVANRLIFPVIIGIAQFIADLLVGQSPPPKGPLSTIDKGGAATMLAWLDGFLGVSLQPVEEVVAQINESLGSIGKMSLSAVNKRLAQLDAALLPFQQRLDIVKAQFEAIAAPAQAALNAIDRQMEQANEALIRGDKGAAEHVRMLDRQREAIQGTLDAQQAQVDNAEIQLALMRALQGEERTLLMIRKGQIPTPVATKTVTLPDGSTVKVPKEKEPTGGTPQPESTPGGLGLPLGDSTTFPTLDELLGQSDIDDARAGIWDAFLGPLAESGELVKFAENQGLLQRQLNRMGNLGGAEKGIAGAFNKVGKIFDLNDPASPLAVIKNNIDDLFDPSSPNSIGAALNRFGDSLANLPVVQSVQNFFSGLFDASNPDSVVSKVKRSIEGLFDPANANSIQATINRLGESLFSLDVSQKVQEFFDSIFDPNVEGSPAQLVQDKVDSLINPDREGSIPYTFSTLPVKVAEAASGLWAQLDEKVFGPVRDFLTGEGEGTLGGIIQTVVDFFGELPSRIVDALQGFGAVAWDAVAVPVINMINGLISQVEAAIRNVQFAAAEVVKQIAAAYGTGMSLLGYNGLEEAQKFMDQFHGAFDPITFGRVSIALPDFLKPDASNITSRGSFGASQPGGATGGLFGAGIMRVGERGEELIASASKLAVFPHEFIRAIDTLSQVLAQPAPMPLAMGGADNRSYNNSVSANFYGVPGVEDATRRFYALRAMKGG